MERRSSPESNYFSVHILHRTFRALHGHLELLSRVRAAGGNSGSLELRRDYFLHRAGLETFRVTRRSTRSRSGVRRHATISRPVAATCAARNDVQIRHFIQPSGCSQDWAANVAGVFGLGVAQLNVYVDTIFLTSSRMPNGSVTSLYFADRIMQLVLGSFAVAVATAILPMMSRQAKMLDFDA